VRLGKWSPLGELWDTVCLRRGLWANGKSDEMTPDQTELFVGNAERRKNEAPEASSGPAVRPQRTLQEYLPQESLLAVRLAAEASSMDDLRQRLTAALPQNSAVTRRRYVESITRWFLRDGCRGFAPTVWARFQNMELQLAIHRYLFLSTQPIMAASVVSVLSRLAEGILVPAEYLGTSMAKLLDHELSGQTQKRLLANLRKLGFLERTSAGDRVVAPPFPRSAPLLALHHAFDVTGPRTIEFAALAANPFWRFIGLRNEDALRDFLKEAEHGGFLGKYVVADRLEQITTCYSVTTLIEKGVEL
jgi:hypothetical protein